MEIVLVRHGQPEWVRDGRNVVDPPLTELGHRQAEAMAERLADEQHLAAGGGCGGDGVGASGAQLFKGGARGEALRVCHAGELKGGAQLAVLHERSGERAVHARQEVEHRLGLVILHVY